MIRTIIAILSALSIIVRQVFEWMERKRLAEERSEQERKDEAHREELERLEENPSGWLADHFSDDVTRVVHPPPMPVMRSCNGAAKAGSQCDSD